ncbi:winged helix-turn-helix transcriptional regulator [Pelagibius litoralis]|uniref:Winged helix-turn-helix transcriptional regulator n=1 Tax=Pelagibius litoralis TaxID=374515 RepID=A0A967F3P3_9PROT|nr:MarR family winged helix-turn-helix transcriptional regulator [Pelagibius litoralis]NIA72295.1 winged helix-turn-helix transcriptional regulator [Pelagibius litoralis]
MTTRPDPIMMAALRAIRSLDPKATNQEIASRAGIEKTSAKSMVRLGIRSGWLKSEGGKFNRRLTLTNAGHSKLFRAENFTKPTADEKGRAKLRACLMCRAEFESTWAGERVCKPCKFTADWKAGPNEAFAVVGGRSI